jgi:adenosine deaminase
MSDFDPGPAGLTDLHRHLDGSLRPSTLQELAASAGREVPHDLAFFPGMGLAAALSRFEFTLSLLQDLDAVRRVAAEMCEDAEADGVGTLEIRFAPQLHPDGGPTPGIVDAALDGIAGRAGLILCGLYGEPPMVLSALVECAADRPGVVGIDLAGGPAPTQVFRLEDYSGPFSRARELGLGRTVHAAEGRPPQEIRVAIEQLHAQRIGHGTTLLEDPTVVELVLEREVTIEACPTSNHQVGVIDSVEEHPLSRWLDLGVRVCVNCDNTLLSAVTSSEEHRRVAQIPGMTSAKLQRLLDCGREGAFPRR